MTIKIFKEKFNQFLAQGGWDGVGSSRHLSNDERPVGFFEILKRIGMDSSLNDRYFLDSDFSIFEVLKFSNSFNDSSSRATEFRHVLAALGSSGLVPDLSPFPLDHEVRSSKKLDTWFMPVLKNFINHAKEQDWYNPKSKDSFLTSILLPASAYKQHWVSTISTIDFLLEQNENKAFPYSLLFSYLSSVTSTKNFDSLAGIGYMAEYSKDEKFKKYIKDNMHLQKDYLEKKFNSKRNTKELYLSSDFLLLNSILKKDYLEGKLSPESANFFKNYVIQEKSVEIFTLPPDEDGYTAIAIPGLQFDLLNREGKQFIVPEFNTKGELSYIDSLKDSFNFMTALKIVIPQFFRESNIFVNIRFTAMRNDGDSEEKYDLNFESKFPSFDKNVDYCFIKIPPGVDVKGFVDLTRKVLTSLIWNESETGDGLRVLHLDKDEIKDKMLNQFPIEALKMVKNSIENHISGIDIDDDSIDNEIELVNRGNKDSFKL